MSGINYATIQNLCMFIMQNTVSGAIVSVGKQSL